MLATNIQVLAFRLSRHGLDERAPASRIGEAARACGVQDAPPGSCALALHARLADFRPEVLDRALFEERSLLRVPSVRNTPYVIPAADAEVFTLALAPRDELEARAFVAGASRHLDEAGLGALEAADRTAEALLEALDGRALTKDELGVELADRVRGRISGAQSVRWDEPDEFGRFGETVVRFALGLVALRGLVCFGKPREEGAATYVRSDQWLGRTPTASDPDLAPRELALRYLRRYGPSTPRAFGEWAGIGPEHAKRLWGLVADETVEVTVEGHRSRLLAADADALESAEVSSQTRFLPPHDPYLLARDRATLVPEPRAQKMLWRAQGAPGALLFEGRVAGAWRGRKKGPRLEVELQPFSTLPKRARDPIDIEAAKLAPFKGVSSVRVTAV